MSESDRSSLIDWTQLFLLRELQPPGVPDVVSDLIAAFLADSAVRMEHLRQAASSGDMDIVLLEAHTLKGSSGPLGATRMQETAEAVERAARTGETAALAAMIDRLAAALAETQAALTQGSPAQ